MLSVGNTSILSQKRTRKGMQTSVQCTIKAGSKTLKPMDHAIVALVYPSIWH
uniref:Uncharacterized protein n=1 Tax=Arundo donax TaxID=35708 RepID=A0A0A9CMN9_ARUDO